MVDIACERFFDRNLRPPSQETKPRMISYNPGFIRRGENEWYLHWMRTSAPYSSCPVCAAEANLRALRNQEIGEGAKNDFVIEDGVSDALFQVREKAV